MQFDFDYPLRNLAGEPMKDDKGEFVTLSKVLANGLSSTNKGDALKLFNWALELWNTGKIDIDKADQKMLAEFINNSENITILVKGQLLEALDK